MGRDDAGLLEPSGGAPRTGEDPGTALHVVDDCGEADLQTGLCQPSPWHAPKAVAALPRSKDLLDPAANAVDRLIPGFKAHRFLQSLKTHLSSATLEDTYLLGRRFLLEELDWRLSQGYSSRRHRRSSGRLRPSRGFRGSPAKRSPGHRAVDERIPNRRRGAR
jgi:hypothetical protein